MDPEAETKAAGLFSARLKEFESLHEGVQLGVRIKSESGTAGLLESLSTTSAAAPLALPDLIALPNADLETAALKGLLHPLDQLDEAMLDPDWYDYARSLAQIQDRTYGLPFAGDALALVYRTETAPAPPDDWSAILNNTVPLVFPAADPQALFTLSQYQAKGGTVRDEEGRPHLDEEILEEVLIFYQEAKQTGVIPSWLTQYEDNNQVWDLYNEKEADLIITWTYRFLESSLEDSAFTIIPTHDGIPYTLSSGWVWAIPAHQPEHQELSLDLAKFLTESNYLGEWTEAAGVLPTRASSLEVWSSADKKPVVENIVLSGNILPSKDVLTSIGQVLKEATVQILNGESDPETAAQQAVEGLTGP
jgi:ABC-type glycerol-3-phosphate transport system substrate-binding protein